MITNFAKIGKNVLAQACGLQRESRKIIRRKQIDELDREASGCFSCPSYKFVIDDDPRVSSVGLRSCEITCKKKKLLYKEDVKYMNERSRYLYKPYLKRYSILLLLFLHYCDPSKDGEIKNINLKAVADLFDCSTNTIKNSLQKMYEYNYITYWQGEDKRFCNVILLDYPSYYLTAPEGGHGYFTLSVEAFKEIIAIKDINQLRITLRALLTLDNSDSMDVKLTVKDLQNELPLYCKPGIVAKAVKALETLKIIHPEINNTGISYKQELGLEKPQERKRCFKDTNIRFSLDPAFSFAGVKKIAEDTYKSKVQNKINSLNKKFNDFNETNSRLKHLIDTIESGEANNEEESKISDDINDLNHKLENIKAYFAKYRFDPAESYNPIELNHVDIENMSRHAVKFGYDTVLEALSDVYNKYIQQPDKHIERFNALLIKFIRTHVSFNSQQKLA